MEGKPLSGRRCPMMYDELSISNGIGWEVVAWTILLFVGVLVF
jgi:hypothetical protein